MRQTNQAGISLIEQFEGLKLTVYRDPIGIPTVGFGHVVRPVDHLMVGDAISRTRAEAFLRADLRVAETAVEHAVTVPLTANQFSALVSFVFNVGAGNFYRSTLLHRLNQNRYLDAANQLLFWVKAGGQVLPGLVRRRKAERALFLMPDAA